MPNPIVAPVLAEPSFAWTAHVETLASIDSTNAEGMRRIAAGERGPLWLRAIQQTGGKGRSGRPWSSAPGNLYASLVMPLSAPLSVVPQLSLVAGVAVADAIIAAVGPIPGLRLKWPNDVLIGTAKLAGILPESTTVGGHVMAVLGIGINVAHHPEGLGRAATHLAEHGRPVAPEGMLRCLDTALAQWLDVWQAGAGFADIRAAWLARAGNSGEAISVHDTSGRTNGEFAGLDEDGALLMRRADGSLQRIAYGDVSLSS
jgi:BirA family transcriptional regulator, biotin operon repressor / biotin---[acetyl-CoA-carboxylase] ligase